MDRFEALDCMRLEEGIPKDQSNTWWLVRSKDKQVCTVLWHLKSKYAKEANRRQSEGGRDKIPRKYTDDKTRNQRNMKNTALNKLAETVGIKFYHIKAGNIVYNKRPELIRLIKDGFLIKNRPLTIREAVRLVKEDSLKGGPIIEKEKLIPEAEKILETYRLPSPDKDKLGKDKDEIKARVIFLKENLPSVVVDEVKKYAINEGNQGRPVMVLELEVVYNNNSQHFKQYFEQVLGCYQIYKATNTIIECSDYDKSYIGSSELTLEKRKRNHYSGAIHTSNTPFSKAILKYEFNWETLTYTNNIKNLRDVESIFIECCDTRKNGYNVSK